MPDRAIVDLLKADADAYTWVGATVGSVCAAGYQLASGHPVMPIGGFNGTDPAPAPDQFLRLALAKRIHYFIVTNPIHEDKWGHLDTNAPDPAVGAAQLHAHAGRPRGDLRPDEVGQASIAAISSTDHGGESWWSR